MGRKREGEEEAVGKGERDEEGRRGWGGEREGLRGGEFV